MDDRQVAYLARAEQVRAYWLEHEDEYDEAVGQLSEGAKAFLDFFDEAGLDLTERLAELQKIVVQIVLGNVEWR